MTAFPERAARPVHPLTALLGEAPPPTLRRDNTALVVVDMQAPYTVSKQNILYKVGWSPLEGFVFPATIEKTFVNGTMVYGNNAWDESVKGKRLLFDRN